MQSVNDFLNTYYGQWVVALAILVAAWIARYIFIYIAGKYLGKLTAKTKSDVDDKLIAQVKVPVGNIMFLVGLYFVLYFLHLQREPYNWHNLVSNIIDTFVIIMAIGLILRLISLIEYTLKEKWQREDIIKYNQVMPFLRDLGKIIIFAGSAVVILLAWGKDPTVLLAGLGIGGLAIGFAAQDTIANIFGSVTIFADRPFDVGDWVIIGKEEGVIEEIGFRTTKVRTFGKTLITIPNSIIANTPVENFSRRPRRRIKQRIGILCETPLDKVKAAVDGINQILVDHPNVEESPRLVYFEDFSDSGLVIFVYYFSNTADWAKYLEVRQDCNLKIMKLFEDLGVELAYPTRTLWHKGEIDIGGGSPKLSDGDIGSGL